MGQGAVVGEEKQPHRIPVQTAGGEQAHPPEMLGQKGEDGGLPGVLGGRDQPGGLIQHEIGISPGGNGFPVHGDDGVVGVFLLPAGGDHAVHRHPAAADQLLGFLPGPAAGGGQELVKAFHGVSPFLFW